MVCAEFIWRRIELTSRQQQTRRTLLDWLGVEYRIERPSNRLLAVAELDSDTWVGARLVAGVAARKASSPPAPSPPRRRRGE